MLQGTLLALNIFLSPVTPQLTQSNYEIPIDLIREVKYVVKAGDTLTSIAEEQYGSSEYWTNLLRDNDWIKDPNFLEEGQGLMLRTTPPLLVAEYERDEVLGDSDEIEASVVTTVEPHVSPTARPTIAHPSGNGPLNDAQMTFLGNCESGMTATRNSGNGYFGAFQFSIGTWNSMGTGYARADLAPLEMQRDAVQRLLARSSIWTQFPGCARKMRSLGMI